MWRRFLGQPDWTGVVRGLIALWLIGFIVYMTFEPPPEANADLVAAARTLAVMVAAFYFGQRVVGRGTVEPAVGSEPTIRGSGAAVVEDEPAFTPEPPEGEERRRT